MLFQIMFSLLLVLISLILSVTPVNLWNRPSIKSEDNMFGGIENASLVKELIDSPPLPQDLTPEEKIEFWHYLIGQLQGQQISPNCDDCLQKYIPKATTFFIVHGFRASHTGEFVKLLRKAFTKRAVPVNMVVVDWYFAARAPNYALAAFNVKTVGKAIAKMIKFLIESKVTSIEKIVFIGHSLGAHTANSVSANLPDDMKLDRIYALDPALPLFDTIYNEEKDRIDATDAEFVIVLHTSAAPLAEGGLGVEEAVGHVDFYPNSGKKQPGCTDPDIGGCSHSRAYYLMAESISRPEAFSACPCESWEMFEVGSCKCNDTVLFGLDTPATIRGNYYFETNANSPYGRGKRGAA